MEIFGAALDPSLRTLALALAVAEDAGVELATLVPRLTAAWRSGAGDEGLVEDVLLVALGWLAGVDLAEGLVRVRRAQEVSTVATWAVDRIAELLALP